MNIDTATKEIRLKSWADIINDRNESGLTVDEYCKIHNLSRNSYYHYLRELKKRLSRALNSSNSARLATHAEMYRL